MYILKDFFPGLKGHNPGFFKEFFSRLFEATKMSFLIQAIKDTNTNLRVFFTELWILLTRILKDIFPRTTRKISQDHWHYKRELSKD